jgi:transposase
MAVKKFPVVIIHFKTRSMIKYSVGIDISMKSFHVCLSVIDAQQHVKVLSSTVLANTVEGFKSLDKWIAKHYKHQEVPLVFTIEATGVYYEQCAMYLFKAGYQLAIVLPNKAKKYLQAIGLKSKNDKIDAKGLARMGAEQCLELWQPMSDFFYKLRTLTRQHQSLQELRTSLGNQLHAQEHSLMAIKEVVRQQKQLISKIDQQIVDIALAIHEHVKSDPVVESKVANICQIKGLGLHTVAVIIAETNGFALFKNIPQLISYSGYDVIENQSGNRKGKTKISKKGNGHIRRALHLPAFNVVRLKVPQFTSLYTRTLEKHSIKMKSYVAVQKKLLMMIYTLWQRNEQYDFEKYLRQSTRDMELEIPSQEKSSADKSALHKVINRRNIAV